MSKRNTIESLLSGYIEGNLKPEEKSQLFDLLADSSNADIFRELLLKDINVSREYQSNTSADPDFQGIYHKILEEIDKSDSRESELKLVGRRSFYKRLIVNISAAAAVFALAFIIGRVSERNQQRPTEVIATTYEVKTPFGSRSEVKLPDGSIVILNAGSLLTYRNDYNSSNRDVTLKGEAYFKVAKNEFIPFIVNAGPLNIRALGTEFNVKAYDDENSIETTLVTGKVEITREGSGIADPVVDLNPNQKAIFVKDEQGFLLEEVNDQENDTVEPVKPILSNILIAPQVNVDQVVAWTEGKLILRGESLDRLCVELERKYDVNIIFIEEDLKKFRFTGVLLDETLEQVLNAIKLTAPISYSLNGKTVYLVSDPNSPNNLSKYFK